MIPAGELASPIVFCTQLSLLLLLCHQVMEKLKIVQNNGPYFLL